MVEALTADERAELLAVVEEQVDELLAITAGADAATIELAVCASVLRTASAEFPAELADLGLGALEARGADAAACLQAVALLGPSALATRAREGLERRAQRVTSQMTDDGVDVADQDSVDGWIGEFNARPDAERDAVLGPTSRASRGRSAPTQKKARRKAARVARRRNR